MNRKLTARKVVALLVLMTGVAGAQSAKPAAKKEDPVVTEARARFEEGVRLGSAGDHEGARLKFNQVWALLKAANVVYNLARAERFSNHPVESLEHFRTFMKMSDDPKSTEAMRTHATEYINELAAQVGQIEIHAPVGARIRIDGRVIDTTDDLVPVTPGTHTVEATLEDKTRSVTIECRAGTIVKAQLTREEPAPALSAPTPMPVSAIAAPTVAPTETRARFWTGGRKVAAIAGGVGVGALAAGFVFHLAAGSASEDADAIRGGLPEPRASACSAGPPPSACTRLRGLSDDQKTDELLRGAFLIGGGALLVSAAALFIVAKPGNASSTAAARIVPITTGRTNGLAVVGTF